ncbi:MAG: 3-dehydroquinate synthase [Ruminococcaceae bacterium]|nr:3-dehydroquinate synthase [Oscillospiraceae bacterium]
MKVVKVNVSKRYEVIIGRNIMQMLPEKIKEISANAKVMLVSDMNVFRLHYKKVRKILDKNGIETECYIFPAGEKSKNAEVLSDLLDRLKEKKFTSSDIILALGGGVTMDLAGLAGASYKNGVGVIQMPTTLLSAVDSSVGGKSAVNLSESKNLAGVFDHPEVVLCDTAFLDTLPENVFADGMAEVIRYSVIADETLFEKVKKGNVKDDIENIIARCVEIKRDFITDDEFDKGRRQKLSFGNTFGRAVEKLSNFSLSHGTTVALGMTKAAEFSYKGRIFPRDLTEQIELACRNNNLNTSCPYSLKDLAEYICKDKQSDVGSINFIAPKNIGLCDIVKLSADKFSDMLENL